MLLSDEIIAAMNDDEIAMLILACHFHDLGMVGTEADNATVEGRDRVRREHAISIGDKLRQRWQELGFDNSNIAEILAEICRGHRPAKLDGVANWSDISEHHTIGPNRFIRVRLISAMIYAADELHIGDDRAPKREQDWKEITTTESLRHWHRHQIVSGPARPTRSISYDVRICTYSVETDIRGILKKALLAVADLKRELAVVGITAGIPEIEIQWRRDDLWKLLIIKACKDQVPRSRDNIRGSVLHDFKAFESRTESLSDLCSERPGDEGSLNILIERSVSDFIARGHLTPTTTDPDLFQLAVDSRSTEYLLTLTRDADKTEHLFARAIDANHEQTFYESETGKRFIREYIFPEIKSSYAVDIATMPENSSLRSVIESSPTACRILRQISTPPSALVQRDLLQLATTAGVCFDLMNNPELFLDKPLRNSIREVFAESSERLPRFMNLIQQLAIIKGFSFDQISQLVVPSVAMQNDLAQIEGESATISISQQFPQERTDWALPHLLLAGERAQETITITNGPEAPLRVVVDTEGEPISRLNQESASMISITPAGADVSANVTLRAGIAFDASRNLLVFTCHKLEQSPQDELPVLVTLPRQQLREKLSLKFSLVASALNIGQLADLKQASELSSNSILELQIHIDGIGPIGSIQHSPESPFLYPQTVADDTLIAIVALAKFERQLPIPCVAERALVDRLANSTEENWPVEFEAVKHALSAQKPTITTITLRFAGTLGQDFREEVLGGLPLGMHFAFKSIPIEGGEQAEPHQNETVAEKRQLEPKLYREDAFSLATLIRDWMDDPTSPFPLNGNEAIQSHYCKTRLEVEQRDDIDRFWYIERPVVFRFCPATKVEQYRVEMDYWQSQGDERRVELLKELIEEAAKNATARENEPQ